MTVLNNKLIEKRISCRRSLKAFIALFCMALCFSLLAGCGKSNQKIQHLINDNGKIHIICTTFPLYDWTCNIVGEDNGRVDVSLLVDDGCDVHSYQATAVDVAAIASCDVLILSGGESEEWVLEAADMSGKEGQIVINLLEELGERALAEEEINGGETPGHNHGHDHGHDEEHEAEDGHEDGHEDTDGHEGEHEHDEEHEEYDEHVWLSLKNAAILCESIKDTLCTVDTQGSEAYSQNLAEYLDRINKLEEEYESVIDDSAKKTVLFADRFPFRYLFEDYDMEYYAAFPGCSAETEASFAVMAYLTERMNDEGLSSIVILEKSSDKIANTIVQSTNNKNSQIFVLDSMQSVNRKDMENGATYLNIMEKNLEVLQKALN